MRFALAVIVAAVADLAAFLAVPNWIGVGAIGAIGYLLFSALGAGWFAIRRPPLAGFLSVLLGAALYGVVSYFSPFVVDDVGQLIEWESRLLLSVLPYAIGGAFAGALGGWLRRRALQRA
ncbi:MAG TPA: hypothetical protein VGQ86_00780 [Candidatus Limnocylindria bacterium]|jgi:hypothetical protein|nr:hypothetical protein [Candidatus Limnocylindria bacterium]